MKKYFFYTLFAIIFFSLGFVIRHWIIFPPKHEHYMKHARSLQATIYGDSYINTPNRISSLSDRYKEYSPSSDNSELRVIFSNGLANRTGGVILSGQGHIYKVKGRSGAEPYERDLVHKISQEKTDIVFSSIINSGVLKFDHAVIDLKKDLMLDQCFGFICDASDTYIEISAPSLEVEKTICVYALNYEISQHPHIREYQILSNIRDQLLALLPESKHKTQVVAPDGE